VTAHRASIGKMIVCTRFIEFNVTILTDGGYTGEAHFYVSKDVS
jgi:hypothetical protein